ncbi:hypothetical protein CWR48_11530 [Oceanobacillus arenosus]|uniref:Uncharacterized protein n=1 Tax=Oceanobacillus arenosus TaxID=1229153 RepID=A0A3D8PSF5_9BACI|nr:hypothetical protein [Oceanobacillus arenosus]RDW18211.1 hypothetical protein CWR48_11530 [Oceanobacillus arenosus]
MILYIQIYLKVLKSNYMLLIMAIVLAFLTFFIWAGFPGFIISAMLENLTNNFAVILLCTLLSTGFLFSMLFMPINLKVAKIIADMKQSSQIHTFVRLEICWILVCAAVFWIVLAMGSLF